MKIWKYFIAPLCIVIAVFGILEGIGVIPPMDSVIGELTPLRICGAILMLGLFLSNLFKLKICSAVFDLSILFMILESNIAFLLGRSDSNLINNWLLLFYTLLICIGLWLILPKRIGRWHISDKGHIFSRGAVSEDYNGHHENNFGSRAVYIDAATFTERYLENNFGQMVVKFENPEAYVGNGLLHVENNFGTVEIRVPANWNLNCQMDHSFAGVDNRFGKGGNGPSLMISGETNFGHVTIRKA